MAGCIASMETWCGTLHLYTNGALKDVLDRIVNMPQVQTVEKQAMVDGDGAQHLHEGYNAKQWAEYAQLKSKIATSTCRTNGKLKALLRDPLQAADPWTGKGSKLHDSVNNVESSDAWNAWVPTAVQAAGCKDDKDNVIVATDTNDEHKSTQDDLKADAKVMEKAEKALTDPQLQLQENVVPMPSVMVPSVPDPQLRDDKSKSWDRKKLLKMYGELNEKVEDTLNCWLKARYLGKHGRTTRRLELLIDGLTNKEMQAALEYCKSKDKDKLAIPCYEIVSSASGGEEEEKEEEYMSSAAEFATVETVRGDKDSSRYGFKIASMHKRGLAQQRRR